MLTAAYATEVTTERNKSRSVRLLGIDFFGIFWIGYNGGMLISCAHAWVVRFNGLLTFRMAEGSSFVPQSSACLVLNFVAIGRRVLFVLGFVAEKSLLDDQLSAGCWMLPLLLLGY